MQQLVADDACGEGSPGFPGNQQAVVADPHASQAFQPVDGPLDHSADLAQAAAVRRPPLSDVRLDPQPSQQVPGPIRVVTPVGEQVVGQFLQSARLAADPGIVEDQGEDLAMVRDVRPCGPDRHGQAQAVDHQAVLRPLPDAVDGAWAGRLAAAEGPDV